MNSYYSKQGDTLDLICHRYYEQQSCARFAFTKTEVSKYDAVIAKWRSNAEATLKIVQIGAGKDVMTLKEVFATEQEAYNALPPDIMTYCEDASVAT